MLKVFAEVGQSLQQIGGDCPAGWVEMVGTRPTNEHVALADGTWQYPTSNTTSSDRDRARAVMNPLRDTFLNRLSGIATFSEDPEIKEHCAQLRASLLDITKNQEFLDATTYQEMEYALLNSYKSIAMGAQDAVRNVFRELEV